MVRVTIKVNFKLTERENLNFQEQYVSLQNGKLLNRQIKHIESKHLSIC
ncbi:hypothetical protein btBTE5EL_000943 (plasmid) [Borrelia turicatae]|nr:hypothetical protein btBTE5EL_000943 [Borrelia turicatae]